tara:strand:- start:7126 stop:7266 length:141 start_codon:yes stop_codon:yes gene_type:complete
MVKTISFAGVLFVFAALFMFTFIQTHKSLVKGFIEKKYNKMKKPMI